MILTTTITKHDGRWWHASYDSGQWTAPTPKIGGAYVGSKGYVCSGAATSWKTRSYAVTALMELGYDSVELA